MSAEAKRNLAALASGLVFGAGLVISGMTHPRKVLAFLDVFGPWDPSLAFVMLGAVGVAALAFRWSRGRRAPLAASGFSLPARQLLDLPLVGGAALFGIGWGLSGYCPGPSVVALASGWPGVLVFVAAEFAGMLAAARLQRRAAGGETSAGELGRPLTS